MPLTREERAEISRQNAKKSTGPRSESGKFAASRNSMKHGLSGSGVHLPEDMAAERDALAGRLAADLGAGGDAETRLVQQMATAFVRLDRCARKESADAADRARNAVREHDAAREDQVRAEARRVDLDPAGALAALGRTAEGRDHLADAWDELVERLADPGQPWRQTERVLKLLGRPWSAHRDLPPPLAAVQLAGLVLQGDPLEKSSAFSYLAPPPAERPTPDEARALLRELCEAERDRHAAEGDRLWRELDGPERSGLVDRALVGTDDESDRLRRYEASASSALHRAIHSLTKLRTLPAQNEANAPAVAPAPQVQPAPLPVADAGPAEVPARNEANLADPTPPVAARSAQNEATEAAPAAGAAEPPARNEANLAAPAPPGLAIPIYYGATPPPLYSPE